MNNQLTLLALFLVLSITTTWSQNADTVVVELGHSSKMILTIKDKTDLEQLKRYDFQAIFDDIIENLENGEENTIQPDEYSNEDEEENTADIDRDDPFERDDQADDEDEYDSENDEDDNEDEDDYGEESRVRSLFCTNTSFNFDFGINNFLEDGRFPDDHNAQYTVHPWGSWYIGVNTILHTDITQKFFIEWGLGVSWFNFKFQDDNTLITKEDNGVVFSEDQRDYNFDKSKLSITYLNASFIPMFATGRNHHHGRFGNHGHDSFRIGLGPYAGIRLESHSKQIYTLDGEKQVDKDRDNFYLNNIRYGLRLQMGVQDLDFFLAYDLNDMFKGDISPKVHALTFGVVF